LIKYFIKDCPCPSWENKKKYSLEDAQMFSFVDKCLDCLQKTEIPSSCSECSKNKPKEGYVLRVCMAFGRSYTFLSFKEFVAWKKIEERPDFFSLHRPVRL